MAKISTKNIALAIYAMTKDKKDKDLSDALILVTDFMVKKRFLPRTSEILKKLEEIINEEGGIIEANIIYKNIPTKKLSDEIEEMIKKRYKAKEIKSITKEDINVLGGVKIEVGDEVIDLTLRNKINQLQNYLITN